MPQQVTLPWHFDMQLAGKLVLSAAALLLLTWAYRFYKSRSLAGAKIPPAEVGGEEREKHRWDGEDGAAGVRRRRGVGGELRKGGEDGEGSIPGGWCLPLRGDRSLPRGEEEEEEGEEVVSESSHGTVGMPKRGSELGSELRSKSGSKPGIEIESDQGSKPGSEPGSKLGSKPGIEMESDQGSKPGSKLGSEPGSKLGSKPGIEAASNRGSKPGIELGREPGGKMGRELASKRGSEPGRELGSELESKLANKPGSEPGGGPGGEPGNELEGGPGGELGDEPGGGPGDEPGDEPGGGPGDEPGGGPRGEPGVEPRGEPGDEPGSGPGDEPGDEPGGEPGNELGSEPGDQLGSEPGGKPGSQPSFYDPEDTAETLRSHGDEDSLAPSSGVSLGIANAQMARDGCTQSMEKDLPIRAMSLEAKRCGATIQTLSVTSDLGLTMTASNVMSDASYSFSSVAKIQVEENYITKQQGQDGARQPVPGLKGRVYDYYVQSISHSVLKKRSVPYIPPGTSRRHSSEWADEELQSFASQKPDPTSAMLDPTTSSSRVLPPTRSLEISSEPPSPARKNSILQIADSPHLQLPMEGFGVTRPAITPPASPQAGLVPSADLFQMPPSTHLDLGNCYQVLCTAKAQKLSHLQEAAYKVMSDNYLQVLRTPSIYSHLNAGERELILQRRMKGKRFMAVADINVQEPGLHTSRLCYYDDGEDCWHHLCNLPPEVVSRGCAMCSMFNYLFVVAGCEGTGRTQRPSNRVFCYDPLNNIWRDICPLNQARPHCKLVALDGHLYAIGGECLSTVERYDPRQDRWTFVAPLPRDAFAVAHAAAACGGEIYVTGGTLRSVLLRYAARADSWSVGLAGGAKERTTEMASADGFLYRFHLRRGAGVGVSRCGAKAKLWYECATYPAPQLSGFLCAAVGSWLHCLGRGFHVRFLADQISPRFGSKELQPFPSPHGSLLAAVLVLPEGGRGQTQV